MASPYAVGKTGQLLEAVGVQPPVPEQQIIYSSVFFEAEQFCITIDKIAKD